MHLLVKANLLAALGLALSAAPLSAATVFSTTLSGANETPPNASTGTGSMLVTLLADTLTVNVTFSGLVSPAVAAHIHCCGPVGVAEPIAVPFNSFPTGVTSGSFTASFDLTIDASYSAAFLTSNGGTAASAEAAFISGLNAGQTYGNIHSNLFPGGEIRGQLAAIPEPASIFLAGGFLLFFALFRRRIV
jgi:CHRD domain-containing protein